MFFFFHKNRIRKSFGRKLRRWIFEKLTKCEKLNVKTSKNNTKLHTNDCIKIFSENVPSPMTTIGETPWNHSPKFTRHTVRGESITTYLDNLKNRTKILVQTKCGFNGLTNEMENALDRLLPWVRQLF